jgi:hypothetical protein
MKQRQILVNLLVIVAMVALAMFCYTNGKANIVFIENMPFDHEGVTYEPFEAIQVTADGTGSPLFLLAGDRGEATLVGRAHILIIEELDENDNIIGTHTINFKSRDLKGNVVNVVPLIHGKFPGWSYPLN